MIRREERILMQGDYAFSWWSVELPRYFQEELQDFIEEFYFIDDSTYQVGDNFLDLFCASRFLSTSKQKINFQVLLEDLDCDYIIGD